MDYKEKYKQALERAKESLNDGTISQNTIDYLYGILPELKESEDEKIRKALIWHLTRVDNEIPLGAYHSIDGVEIKDMIAWLEKQKKLEKETTIAWHDVSEEPQEMRELFCEWESDDATWHDVCFYDSKTNKFRQNKMPIDNVTKWTYVDELLELQKTVEWSEEDEIHRQWILECLADGKRKVPEYSEQYQSLFDWFESLKQRIGG